jgi:hypothetical protein
MDGAGSQGKQGSGSHQSPMRNAAQQEHTDRVAWMNSKRTEGSTSHQSLMRNAQQENTDRVAWMNSKRTEVRHIGELIR